MYTNKQLTQISTVLAERVDAITEFVLARIARRVKRLGELDAQDVREIDKLRNIGADMGEIARELSRVTGKTITEVNALYEALAKDAYEGQAIYYAARGIQQIAFEDNEALQMILQAQETATAGTFQNIANTTAFRLYEANGAPSYKTIERAYIEAVDNAILAKQQGFTTWQKVTHDILQPLINSGVRTVEYDSGYSRNIYSAARMNILEGARELNNAVRMQTGEEFGADGYEISVHMTCAPDHLDIQGKQYSKESYRVLNENLKRPIGTLNCGHHIFPVILGISGAAYDENELAEITRLNKEQNIVINGKKYTQYEASQVQRKLENKARQYKLEAAVYEEAGDADGANIARNRYRETRKVYQNISKQAGLRPQFERMRVPTKAK